MSKHAIPVLWEYVEQQEPKHRAPWSVPRADADWVGQNFPYTPGRHAKPFAAHHPAGPVTYDAQGTVTPLTPAAHVLDVAA